MEKWLREKCVPSCPDFSTAKLSESWVTIGNASPEVSYKTRSECIEDPHSLITWQFVPGRWPEQRLYFVAGRFQCGFEIFLLSVAIGEHCLGYTIQRLICIDVFPCSFVWWRFLLNRRFSVWEATAQGLIPLRECYRGVTKWRCELIQIQYCGPCAVR